MGSPMVVTLGQQYNNVGEKPTVMLYTYYTNRHAVDPMLLSSGNPFKCHEEVLYLQPLIPLKRFDIFPPDWEMRRRSSRRVLIFL